MKFSFPVFLLILLTSQANFAQCYREAPFQDGPDYALDGKATLTFLLNGTKTLAFDNNFSTTDGPDLHVYLSQSATVSTPGGVLQTPNTIDLGLLKSASGAQSYDVTNINPSIELSSYTYVIIHCKDYNHYWGTGTFGTNKGIDCSNLSTKNESFQNLNIYPTIISNQELFIDLPNPKKAFLNIFSITGKKIKNSVVLTNKNNRLDLGSLSKGLYLVQINQTGHRITKKIIIP